MGPAGGRTEADDVRVRRDGVVFIHLLGLDVEVAFDDAEEAPLAAGGRRVARAAGRRQRPGARFFQQVGSASDGAVTRRPL